MRTNPKYQSRFCWWCGTALATTGFKKVVDRIGNDHVVHGLCSLSAVDEMKILTAQPTEWPSHNERFT